MRQIRLHRDHSPLLPNKQKGVALITAMLIVALVTALAVEISWRFQLDVSRSANRWYGIQAKAYQEGAELLAMKYLKEDLENEETNQADGLYEDWATVAEFPTDDGWIRGRLEDARGRLNINKLTPETGKCPNGKDPDQDTGQCLQPASGTCDKYNLWQQQFIRLLQAVNIAGPDDEEPVYLEPTQAEEITEALIDWLDSDNNVTGYGGAESDYYEQLEPVVSIGNQPMASVTELMLVKGMQPVIYKAILPYIIALPVSNATAAASSGNDASAASATDGQINLNTAPAMVLRTLKPEARCDLLPLTEEEGEELASYISSAAYPDYDTLKNDGALPNIWLDANGQFGLNGRNAYIIESDYFLFFSEIGIGDSFVRKGSALIHRAAGAATSGSTSGNTGSSSSSGSNTDIKVVRRTDANF